MSFGSSKKSVSAAPVGFNSTFGATYNKGGTQYYAGVDEPGYRNIIEGGNQIAGNYLSQLPQSLSISDYYNNPFYGQTSQLFRMPIDQQYAQDRKEFDNQLNARNQIGSSYDAYQRDLMSRRYDQLYNQADLQARSASADAYQANLANLWQGISGAQGAQGNALQNYYYPGQIGNALTAQPNQLANLNAQIAQQNAQRNSLLGAGIGQALGTLAGSFIPIPGASAAAGAIGSAIGGRL
mgnify:CR=1 FL=1